MSSRFGGAALGLATGLLPGPAFAHSALPGVDGFWVGLLHPLAMPEQVLALLALGVAIGHHWPAAYKIAGPVFAVATAAGLASGFGSFGGFAPAMPLLVVALIAAVFTVVSAPLPGAVSLGLSTAAGGLIGLAAIPDPGPLPATMVTIAGSWIGANLVLFYASAGVGRLRDRFPRPWLRIGLRVLASWIGAIACLMFALAFAA